MFRTVPKMSPIVFLIGFRKWLRTTSIVQFGTAVILNDVTTEVTYLSVHLFFSFFIFYF